MNKKDLELYKKRVEVKWFEQLINCEKIPQSIKKVELKKLCIIKGMSVATFHNYFFVLEAFDLIKFDKPSGEWVFESDFYNGGLDGC